MTKVELIEFSNNNPLANPYENFGIMGSLYTSDKYRVNISKKEDVDREVSLTYQDIIEHIEKRNLTKFKHLKSWLIETDLENIEIVILKGNTILDALNDAFNLISRISECTPYGDH